LSLPPHPLESFRWKVGNGNRLLVARSLGAEQKHLVGTVLEKHRAYYAEHFCVHSKPYPGIRELLRELKEGHFKLAVLSNKPDEFTRKLVNHVFNGDFFDRVRGELSGIPLKPDPTSALALAAQMKVAPQQVAYLGDTGVDMQTARNANMYAIGAKWGFRGPEELQQNGCQALIEHPRELPGILAT